MHSSIAVLVLLGAGAIAHPSLKHRHLHNKRDTVETFTQGGNVIVEHVEDVYVTVPPGGQMPPAQTTSSLAIPENLAVETPPASSTTAASRDAQEKLAYPVGNGQGSGYHQYQYSESQAPAPVETFPAPVSSPTQTSEVAPPASSPVVASASAAQTSAASSPGSSGTFWAKSPMSPLSGGSGAKDVLAQANYWRNKWLSLPPFVWSSVLANNSYMTTTQPTTYTTNSDGTKTPHNEGGAEVMGHDLYPGSSSQCIASGDGTTITDGYTPFEKAFLMWICEEPNANIPCSALGYNGPVTETGHADIIKGTVGQIGCYYMNAAGSRQGCGPVISRNLQVQPKSEAGLIFLSIIACTRAGITGELLSSTAN